MKVNIRAGVIAKTARPLTLMARQKPRGKLRCGMALHKKSISIGYVEVVEAIHLKMLYLSGTFCAKPKVPDEYYPTPHVTSDGAMRILPSLKKRIIFALRRMGRIGALRLA